MFEVGRWFVSWPQVVLDCPTDACFVYTYQYEPYLRDPVAYPKVQVRQWVTREDHGSAIHRDPLGLFEAGARNTKSTGRSTDGIIVLLKMYRHSFKYDWIQELKDSSVSGLCFLCMGSILRWSLCGMAETVLGNSRLLFVLLSHLRGM